MKPTPYEWVERIAFALAMLVLVLDVFVWRAG